MEDPGQWCLLCQDHSAAHWTSSHPHQHHLHSHCQWCYHWCQEYHQHQLKNKQILSLQVTTVKNFEGTCYLNLHFAGRSSSWLDSHLLQMLSFSPAPHDEGRDVVESAADDDQGWWVVHNHLQDSGAGRLASDWWKHCLLADWMLTCDWLRHDPLVSSLRECGDEAELLDDEDCCHLRCLHSLQSIKYFFSGIWILINVIILELEQLELPKSLPDEMWWMAPSWWTDSLGLNGWWSSWMLQIFLFPETDGHNPELVFTK